MQLSLSTATLIGTTLLLGACGSEQAAPPVSPEQVKAEMAKAVKPRPGMYRTTVRVTKFEIPGMPADQAAKMQGMFAGAGQDSERCMTQAEADRGFEDVSKGFAQGDCTAERFEVTGGNIDARFTCRVAQGATTTVAMAGQASAESMNLKMNIEAKGPAGTVMGIGAMQTEMEISSTRTGDCPG